MNFEVCRLESKIVCFEELGSETQTHYRNNVVVHICGRKWNCLILGSKQKRMNHF